MLVTKKYTKILKLAICLFIATMVIFFAANFALAAAPVTGFGTAPGGTQTDVGQAIGLGARDPRVIAASIINVALGFLGIIAVSLIIYAGWPWMTSAGDERKIEQAKNILKNAAIGLIIILSAFAIASFILNSLLGAVPSGGIAPPGGGDGGGISALGSGIISSHYPERGQKDIARNTKIAVTFKEAMDPATIITGDKINAQNIKIYKTKELV